MIKSSKTLCLLLSDWKAKLIETRGFDMTDHIPPVIGSPVQVLLDLMALIEAHPPIVELLKKEDPTSIFLTDSSLLPDDVDFLRMIDRWEYLADSYLINEDGTPNMERLALLEQRGYRVGPGDQDSFGWITGKIRKGRLVYIFG